MIFLANVLELNGGTTFLVRTCRALQAIGRPCAVLVLRPGGDPALARELARHARVLRLGDFQLDRARLFRKQWSAFAPLRWSRLAAALSPFGSTLHAMGGFGLIVAARLARHVPTFRVTVGVYHQNEFIYRERPFFSADLLALFRRVPASNLLFFNEVSRENYARFHVDGRYRDAAMAPIGIHVPPPAPAARRPGGRRIVSVGNLEAFKTYNAHVIGLLPDLQTRFPDIAYHVYGAGEQLGALQARARDLGVDHRVIFHGSVAYDRLSAIWADADVFVGSGTALIEAAAAGLPALVGVESMDQPLTYGFLSDIQGLSYNEFTPDVPLRPMGPCIDQVLRDDAAWSAVAASCATKAQEFAVERTAQGFVRLAADAVVTPFLLSGAAVSRMLVGLPLLVARDKLSPGTAFARRRNQSFKVETPCPR